MYSARYIPPTATPKHSSFAPRLCVETPHGSPPRLICRSSPSRIPADRTAQSQDSEIHFAFGSPYWVQRVLLGWSIGLFSHWFFVLGAGAGKAETT
jgi:hypothetical protein